MVKYHVLMSESLAKTILVDAESEDAAMEKVDGGDWYDKDVVREKVIDRFAVEAEVWVDPPFDRMELL
tara:strand:+ start:1700 stop:1903 length:204 start_codon:yes stop_codon:yes gene_type:complete